MKSSDSADKQINRWIYRDSSAIDRLISEEAMRRLYILLLLVVFLAPGCAAFHQPAAAPRQLNNQYYEQIRDWQNRVKKEGWGKTLVDDVIDQCIILAKYRMEKEDHWDTPKEFMEKGFQGDCEDIAVFMMATLKRVNYPYRVRVVAVKT
ncbi:hypothetical protein ACFL0H_09025 [Thermodesulfobacteriota bacterium]